MGMEKAQHEQHKRSYQLFHTNELLSRSQRSGRMSVRQEELGLVVS